MRLADAVLRRGHLSDTALIEVWESGVRPAHLDRCSRCADRALEMSRWLEDVQALGRADADAVFSEDRLATQHQQVMTRLAQLDRPSKVISFPAASPATRQPFGPRRVRAGWIAAAAAAGLMLGVVSIELSHILTSSTPVQIANAPAVPDNYDLLDSTYDTPLVGGLEALEHMTPRVADIVLASNR